MSANTTQSTLPSNGTAANQTSNCVPLGVKECYPGLYCPNVNSSDPSTFPQKCQETPECASRRLLGKNCAPNEFSPYGAQGKYEPILCPKGSFCKTPATVEPCPKGYFCPSGTFEPTKCDLLAFCPEGSIQQKSFTGLAAAGGLDIILLFLCFLQWRFDKYRIANQNTAPLVSVVNEKSPAEKSEVPGNDIQETLVGSFRKSMNGKDLKMDFRVKELNYTLPSGKSILQGVSGEIKAGRMTAIVGPSGAGKTTFMNVLCGKVDRTSGKLFISGKEVELAAFKKIYGFVPQEDVMHRELTVRENILHSARIRLPKSWTAREVEDHVDNVLKALNLSHVAQSPIGDGVARGVSGGQRKRVNIGIELVATPLCLCLDEPTSGLDSTAALEVADTLSKITKLGMTVIAVIHQPRIEIFKKFDDVLMIVPGGRTAYFGPTADARRYFESMGFRFVQGANDSDTLMDILSGAGDNVNGEYNVDELVEKWENRVAAPTSSASDSAESQDTVTHESSSEVKRTPSAAKRLSQTIMERLHIGTYALKEDDNLTDAEREFHEQAANLVHERGASFWTQFYYATALSILQQYRSIADLVLEIGVGLIAGLLMGMALTSYDEIYVGVMKAPFTSLSPAPVYFLTPLFTMLVGLAIALGSSPAGTKVFSEEMEIYWRNASSGHSPLAYYLGKTLATFPRIFVVGTHFAGIVFYLSGPVIPFYINWFMIGFIFYGIYGLCAFVSMVVSRQNATLLSVIFTLFYGVFCGFGPTLVDAKKWGLLWIWWLSFNMWANEAYYGRTVRYYDGVYNSDLINEVFGFTFDQTFFDIAMMVVIGSAWRVFAYFAMINFNKQHQR